MMIKNIFKASACAAVLIGSVCFGTSVSFADQNSAPGQIMKGGPNLGGNGNNNGNANGLNNPNSRRNENCRGRNCGQDEILTPDVPVNVVETDDDVEIIDCALPQHAEDPLCYVPVAKPSKRKLVSVKMSSEEPVIAPAVIAAPAVTAVPAVAPSAPARAVSPKLVEVNVFSASGMTKSDDLSSTNFQ